MKERSAAYSLPTSLVCILLAKGVKRSFDSVRSKMKLGRESAYAIEGLLVLAAKPFGTPMLLRDIAASREVPRSFLAKIFQKLARNDIVLSSRGAIRGYALARQAKNIQLKEILLATEGPDLFDRCILWSDRCSEAKPCPLHGRWKRARRRIVAELMERTTLADLVAEQDG